jgi:hypothetical protein
MMNPIRSTTPLRIYEQGGSCRACEHLFVTSDGSPYARFRRVLLTKNPGIVLPAAAELPSVSLEDALRILVILAEKRHDRFERAAARFGARVVLERALAPAEAHRVLALAQSLPESPEAVALLLRRFL